MPRVNQAVAKRFVKSGLWDPKKKKFNLPEDEPKPGDILEENWQSGP